MAVGTNTIGTGAGTIVQGQRVSTDVGSTRRKPQWTGEDINISPDTAPLTAFIDKLGKNKEVGRDNYFHLETDYNPLNVASSTSYNSSATTIVVSSGQGARVVTGSLMYHAGTGEVIRVTNRATDTLTVTRGFGSSTADSIGSGDELQILSSAFTEGSNAPNGISSEPALKTNYCQTFRAALELSGRDINSDNFGEDEVTRIKKNTLESLMRQREQHFVFSPIVNSTDPTVTGGLQYWLTTNVTNISGVLTESALETWWVGVMRRNFEQKNLVVFAGENFCLALDGFGRDNIRFDPDDTVAGISISRWQSSFGTLKVVRHGLMSPLGTGIGASTTDSDNNGVGGWAGYAMGVNLNLTGKRSYKNRGKVTLEEDAQTPGTDGKKWVYTQDCGLWLASEKQHGKLYGITG